MELALFAYKNRIAQLQAVESALLKLELMGLTIQNGMIGCNPPVDIYHPRWKAMLTFYINNGEPK